MNLLHTLQITHSYSKGLIALLALLVVGCTSISPTTQTQETSPPTQSEQLPAPYTAHVAFAGGGWRAHTGHSAWTMSLLDNGNKTLNQAFAKVGTISSNSGGSWFSTMLTYSDSFVKAIEAPNAINNWPVSNATATGWLGQQQYLFDKATCHAFSGDLFLACVFRYYTGSVSNAINWKIMVEDIVFRNNKINQSLSGQRQAWAANKPLLLAATMLTTNAVLSSVYTEKQYYQACLSPSKPVMNGNQGASCSQQIQPIPDVTPVTFSSIPSRSHLTTPPFFSALDRSRYFNLGYTENAILFTPSVYNTIVGNPITSNNVPVITAAAASSAAGGFTASEKVTGHWEESYIASDEALSFQLSGPLKYVKANGLSAKTLADNKIVQIADGGAVDNSGVAQLVSFLQKNNQANGFNIVAFDNVEEVYSPVGVPVVEVGSDIAYLFGRGLSPGNKVCAGGYCVLVPDLQIFKIDPLLNTAVTWKATASSNNPPKLRHELIYTKYRVTTVDNSSFGIKAGSTGTLHAFTAAWTDAGTAPQDAKKDKDFKAYAAMLKFINQGLQKPGKNGETGISHLKRAMGIR